MRLLTVDISLVKADDLRRTLTVDIGEDFAYAWLQDGKWEWIARSAAERVPFLTVSGDRSETLAAARLSFLSVLGAVLDLGELTVVLLCRGGTALYKEYYDIVVDDPLSPPFAQAWADVAILIGTWNIRDGKLYREAQ